MDPKLAKQIEQQEKKLNDEKKKLASLQEKAREFETKRFQRLATKVGFFDVTISDKDLESALKRLVDAAGSPQSSSAATS